MEDFFRFKRILKHCLITKGIGDYFIYSLWGTRTVNISGVRTWNQVDPGYQEGNITFPYRFSPGWNFSVSLIDARRTAVWRGAGPLYDVELVFFGFV